jgi:hypothetical protein
VALESRFVEDQTEIDALAPDWKGLAAEHPNNPLFLSLPWLRSWRRHFGGTTRSGVLTFRDGGTLVGVMPLMIGRVRRGPALTVRFDYRPGDHAFFVERPRYRFLRLAQVSPVMGLESSNLRGGIRSAPGFLEPCRRECLAFLGRLPGWSVGVFPAADRELAGWQTALSASGLTGRFRPVARLLHSRHEPIAWSEFLLTRGRDFRRSVAKAENRAKRQGMEMRVLVGSKDAQQGLDALCRVAELSWKTHGRSDETVLVPLTAATRAFYGELCTNGSGELVPVFEILYQGETPRAAMLSIACGKVLVPCVTYYDPEIARVYPGRLLMKTCLDWSYEAGMERLDFNATHPWIGRYADTADVYNNLIVFADNPTGRLVRLLFDGVARDVIDPAQAAVCRPTADPSSDDA